MADDAVRSDDYVDYIERLTGVPVDRVVDLSYAELEELAGASDLFVRLPRPLTLTVDGKTDRPRGRPVAADRRRCPPS